MTSVRLKPVCQDLIVTRCRKTSCRMQTSTPYTSTECSKRLCTFINRPWLRFMCFITRMRITGNRSTEPPLQERALRVGSDFSQTWGLRVGPEVQSSTSPSFGLRVFSASRRSFCAASDSESYRLREANPSSFDAKPTRHLEVLLISLLLIKVRLLLFGTEALKRGLPALSVFSPSSEAKKRPPPSPAPDPHL